MENIININNFEFDFEFYILYYDDLNNIKTHESALDHWNNSGKYENRICNIKDLSIEIFDYEIYIKMNYDIYNYTKRNAIIHWLKHGKHEERIYNINQINDKYDLFYYNKNNENIKNIMFDYEIYILFYNLNNISNKRSAFIHWLDNGKNIENVYNIYKITINIFDYEIYLKFNDKNNFKNIRDAIIYWIKYEKDKDCICNINDINDNIFDYELYISYYNLDIDKLNLESIEIISSSIMEIHENLEKSKIIENYMTSENHKNALSQIDLNKRNLLLHWLKYSNSSEKIFNIYNISNILSNNIFDYDIYINFNDDIKNFNYRDALIHWLKLGKYEGRICKIDDINNELFDYEVYLYYYNVNNIRNKRDAVIHWIENKKDNNLIININKISIDIFDYELYFKLNNLYYLLEKKDIVLHWLKNKDKNYIFKIDDVTNELFDYEIYINYYNLTNITNKRDALIHCLDNKKIENSICKESDIKNDLFDHEIYLYYYNLDNIKNRRDAIIHMLKNRTNNNLIICTINDINNEIFDYEFYTKFHSDLNKFNKRESIIHWFMYGKNENRVCTLNQLNNIDNIDNTIFDLELYMLYYNLNNLSNRDIIFHWINNTNKIVYDKIDKITDDIFNFDFYTKFYNDLNNINKREAFIHWIKNGKNENRICSINEINNNIFDYEFYSLYYDDLKDYNNNSLLLHWLLHGKNENRICTINQLDNNIFDYDFYITYNDIKILNTEDNEKFILKRETIINWLKYGKNEYEICNINELSNDIFDYNIYINLNKDLNKLESKRDNVFHWLIHGKNENRIFNLKTLHLNINLIYNFNMYYYLIEKNLINDDIFNINLLDLIKKNIVDSKNTIPNKELLINKFIKIFYNLYQNILIDNRNSFLQSDIEESSLQKKIFSSLEFKEYIIDKFNNTSLDYDDYKNILRNNIDKLKYKELYLYYIINNNNETEYLLNYINNLNENVIVTLYKKILVHNIDNLTKNNLKLCSILNNVLQKDGKINDFNKLQESFFENESNKLLKNNKNFIGINNTLDCKNLYMQPNIQNLPKVKEMTKEKIIPKDSLENNQIKLISTKENIIQSKNGIILSNEQEFQKSTVNNIYLINNKIKNIKNKINNFITFIIPTIGRQSLLNTITSLKNLIDKNWKALIIFDGIKNEFTINDNRITILETEKKGNITNCGGNAGYVRNIGLDYINDSEWIAFLDDDDYLHKNYINYLKEEINKNNNIDICIFRMAYGNKMILPEKEDNKIIKTKVGISFAINLNIAKNFKFINSNYEDYLFLKKVELYGGKILISKYVAYYVRVIPYNIREEFETILINN
jgi:hypothetical protein